jgi:hypothetical protein
MLSLLYRIPKEERTKTNAINNKDIQSDKKYIIVYLFFCLIIFQSVKSLITKCMPQRNKNNPREIRKQI